MVQCLLKEYHADPNSTNKNGDTPLGIARSPAIIKELLKYGGKARNVFNQFGHNLPSSCPKQPAGSAVKVYVIGRRGGGKTTLTEALKLGCETWSRLTNRWKQVCEVEQHTAGIIPHELESRRFGHIALYDFAGHDEFYASHSVMLRNSMAGSSAAVFLLVADLCLSVEELKGSILLWFSLIENQLPSTDSKPHMIFLGSHAIISNQRKRKSRSVM